MNLSHECHEGIGGIRGTTPLNLAFWSRKRWGVDVALYIPRENPVHSKTKLWSAVYRQWQIYLFVSTSFNCAERVREQKSTYHNHRDPRSLQDPEISRKIVAPPASATNITIGLQMVCPFTPLSAVIRGERFGGRKICSVCCRPTIKPDNITLQRTTKLNHIFKKKNLIRFWLKLKL